MIPTLSDVAHQRKSDWFYPTAFSHWNELEWAAMARVLSSGRLTMGPETEAFEAEIAAWHGRKHAIAVNSGSSANLVAVAAAKHLHVDDGDILRDDSHWREGIALVPAIAWATTYAPLLQHRYDLVLSDVDRTWNANPGLLIDAINNEHRFQVVVGCSILGNPAPLGELRGFTDRQGTILIEDNCESLGARTADGRLTGTFGHLSTGSGFYSHQLSAIELGWILTDDDDLARLCRLLRNHGNDGWSEQNFSASYNFVLFGYNVRPVEMHCAIAREQLKKQNDFAKERRRNWRHFMTLADGSFTTNSALPIRPQEMRGDPNPFGIAFTINESSKRLSPTETLVVNEVRDRLVAALRAEGIDCRLPTGGSFTRHPYGAPWRDQPTPNADRVHDTGLFLGNAPFPIDEQIERAIKVMRRVLL
jgi:CDP-6-deoxy-D-xylo-4-hexulose-3-dehydrase